MKKPFLILIFVILGLSLSSCNLLPFGVDTETESEPESNAPQEQQDPSSEAETEGTEEGAIAEEETEDATPSRVSSVAGLTRATDPEDFLQQRGNIPGENRQDPFTLFPVAPQEEIENIEDTEENAEPLPTLPETPSAPPPEIPQPEIARGVQVQGAIKIGNEVVAILKAPNEQTSRYVRPGQLIANGQVLLKSININQRPTPTVVLEELGIDQEVIKPVEEGMEVESTTATGDSPQRLLPPPPPLLGNL